MQEVVLLELRRLLGVLRAPDERAELAPQPGLSELPALVARTEAAGLPVDVRVEGEPAPLPLGVDLSAFGNLKAFFERVAARPSVQAVKTADKK